jgi:hypothetical protein
LKAKDFKKGNVNKTTVSNMKKVMNLVEFCANREQFEMVRAREWNVEMTIRLFNVVKEYFQYGGEGRKRKRDAQLSWKTYLNTYLKEKKVFANGALGP